MTHGLGEAVSGLLYIIDDIIKAVHENRINDALLIAAKARREAEGYQAVAKVYQGRMNDLAEINNKLRAELSATQKELDELKAKEKSNEEYPDEHPACN